MRMKSIILIFIALGCGLVASIGISQVMNRDGSSSMEMEQILVALSDIDIGSKLDAQNVRLEDWPKAKIPDGAVRRLEDVKNKYSNARFFKGEPLHVNRISDSLGNIAVKVPPGYRAMPVKVDEDTVMKGISPGDRVDVMVFLKRDLNQGIMETGAYTILKNVRVFAINTNTERATDSKAEAANFKTVSLLVKPDHARELIVAAQVGKINLTLRRPDEKDELGEGEELTPLRDILAGHSHTASEPTASSASPTPDNRFLGFVKDNVGAPPSNVVPPPSAAPAVEPVWSMVVLGPAERKRYDWNDLKQLPVETVVSTSPGSPPPLPALSHATPTGGSDQPSPGSSGDESKSPSGKDSK
jgi:pilus assembly protein CpaB